jgi:hypothetical protein
MTHEEYRLRWYRSGLHAGVAAAAAWAQAGCYVAECPPGTSACHDGSACCPPVYDDQGDEAVAIAPKGADGAYFMTASGRVYLLDNTQEQPVLHAMNEPPPSSVTMAASADGVYSAYYHADGTIYHSPPIQLMQEPALIASGEECATSIATTGSGALWIASCADPQAVRMYDGVSVSTLVTASGISSLGYDHDEQRAYWAEPGGRIASILLDGTGEQEIAAAGSLLPWYLAVDSTHVYFIDGTRIRRIAHTDLGAELETIASGLAPAFLALDASSFSLAWGDLEAAQVMRSDPSGGEVEVIARGTYGLSGVASSDFRVFWIDNGAVFRYD